MGIESALYTGVSGLDAMSQQLSVIGNDISNSNTVGFKAGTVTFANLLSTSLGATSSTSTGNGVTLEAVGTDFSQGTLQTTSNPLDMAIQGSGFFIVRDTNGSEYFTRAGQFSVDQNGNIVNPSGDFLQGAIALTQPKTTKTGVTPGTFGAIQDINITSFNGGAPTATSQATIFANLSSGSAVYAPTATGGNATFNIVSGTNDTIFINGAAYTLAPGSYCGGDLTTLPPPTAAQSLAAQLTGLLNGTAAAVAGATYLNAPISAGATVSYSAVTDEFTIDNTVGAAALNIQWGNAKTTAANIFGFSNTNTAGTGAGTTVIAAGVGGTATSDFQTVGFDPNNPPSGAFSTSMTVYDSLGNSHLVSIFFEQTPVQGSWMYWAVVPSSDSVDNNAPQIATQGTLNFNTNTGLETVKQGYDSFNFSGGGGQNQKITFDFGQLEGYTSLTSATDGTTQSGSGSSVTNQYQNGYSAGSLSSFSVSQTGIITGTYTNGQTEDIAQIQLARFNAPNELTNVGNNLYTQSATSGQPIPGQAGKAGFGSIFSESLEESNVDLSGEFVNMITVQSAYEADAKVISTAQQLFTALQNAKQ